MESKANANLGDPISNLDAINLEPFSPKLSGSENDNVSANLAKDIFPVEKAPPPPRGSIKGTDQIQSQPGLVSWDGPNDSENPRNWSKSRKWKAVIAISGFVLMSPLSTTIVAPALDVIAAEVNVTNNAQKPMILSIFLLGFAVGPLFISPLSEIFGRTRVLQLFNAGYLVFNTACGFARTGPEILILRFLSGLFGSASVGIGAGTIGDLFEAKDRGKAIAVYSLAPLIGPILGPIVGGFLTEHVSWRWTFFTASILDGVIQLFGLFFLDESYTPVLLRRKRKRLEKGGAQGLYTPYDFPNNSRMDMAKTSMIRPFKLLATQPVVQVLALYQGYLYGNIYILYAYFPTLWTERYHERLDIASLNYLSLGIGTTFAAEVTTHINDRIYRLLTARNHGKGVPEFRVPIMIPATILLAIGLFWYGWSAHFHLHWIMPNIGVGIFTAAAYICTLSNNIYIVDTYGRYSASGLAAISMFRCLAGFAFPIFSPFIYQTLDYGWTSTLLGLIAICIGLPGVVFLWRFGATLRAKSPYCAESD